MILIIPTDCKSVQACEEINKIIVADNSTEININVLNQLKNDKTDIIITENNGYANGNNAAIEHLNKNYGKFDFLIISNPDIIMDLNLHYKLPQFFKSK